MGNYSSWFGDFDCDLCTISLKDTDYDGYGCDRRENAQVFEPINDNFQIFLDSSRSMFSL